MELLEYHIGSIVYLEVNLIEINFLIKRKNIQDLREKLLDY